MQEHAGNDSLNQITIPAGYLSLSQMKNASKKLKVHAVEMSTTRIFAGGPATRRKSTRGHLRWTLGARERDLMKRSKKPITGTQIADNILEMEADV